MIKYRVEMGIDYYDDYDPDMEVIKEFYNLEEAKRFYVSLVQANKDTNALWIRLSQIETNILEQFNP